ncbi:MAG: DUF5684 domain-containing protein [Terrimicrobiaceae bacterium]
MKITKKAGVFSLISLVSAGSLLAQSSDIAESSSDAGAVIGGTISFLFSLIIAIAVIAGMWKVFVKAGEPGWAAIVPFYNLYVLCKITAKPVWWMIFLLLCPFVNIIMGILITIALAKSFGKGIGFAIGLILLPVVFYPILGFGDATYTAPQQD